MKGKNIVTQEKVDEILKTAQIQTIDVLGKPTTLVGIKFTNGFVMV